MIIRGILPLFVGLLSFCAISTSYIMESVLLLAPCKLCLYQRYLQIFILGSTFLYTIAYKHQAVIRKLYSWLIITLLSASFLLAGVQYSVENKYIIFNSSCISQTSEALTIEGLKNMIEQADLVPCDQKGKAIFLALNPVELTLLYSSITLLVSIYLAIRENKKLINNVRN